MTKRTDWTGKRVGNLTVISYSHTAGKHHWAYWKCRCDCGNEILVTAGALRVGQKTCGCRRNEFSANDGNWREVVGYPLYEVSDDGRVRVKLTGKMLSLNSSGEYNRVCLSQYNHKHISVHRAVAMAFVDGYADGLVVNHKDENKRNNHADNLEWVTSRENTLYGSGIQRCVESKIRNGTIHNATNAMKKSNESRKRRVGAYTLDGELVHTYNSVSEAGRAVCGKNAHSNISSCLAGKIHSSYGYVWKYLDKEKINE